MFELPECLNLAAQMGRVLPGKTIAEGRLGNSPHKFLWYNRSPEEFARLSSGKRLGPASARGRWLFLPLESGYVLVFGECGGRILYHESLAEVPEKYHLLLRFADGSALSATTRMWGAMELYAKGEERKRQYLKDMRPVPLDPEFDFEYFSALIDACLAGPKRSVKSLLTQDQLLPGLGNSIAQDIMFNARLHPKRPLAALGAADRRRLYKAIMETLGEAIRGGGRQDEADLFGKPGDYRQLLGRKAIDGGCPACGGRIEKIQYLGGSSYFCPRCQAGD